MKILNNLDLQLNQLINAKSQMVAGDPGGMTAADEGRTWYDSTAKISKLYDGTSVQKTTNIIEGVSATLPISAAGIVGKSQIISIAAASGGAAGTMSAGDFTKLANAVSTNTLSALVIRDGSGNFAAGTITAALTGTASNATTLAGSSLATVLSRSSATGESTFDATQGQTAATVTNFNNAVHLNRLDQLAVPTADVALNSRKITGLADPLSPQDAATKNYVDGVASGLDIKASVRLVSPVNLAGILYSPSGGTSGRGQITTAPNVVDGVTVVAGNRILLRAQTTGTGAANGIWTVTTVGTGATGVWDRATDFDTDVEVTDGAFCFVEEGTGGAACGWVLTNNNPVVIGGASGTVLVWAQFSGAGSYVAGNGLGLAGNSFSVTGTANRIAVSGAGVDIAGTYVGQNTITTVGAITTGTWNATDVAVADGGTGASTAALARTNLGATTKFAVNVGDGANGGLAANVSETITHSLNTTDVVVSLFEVAGGAEVFANVTHTSVNTLTLSFAVAPVANSLRCVVIG